MSRSFFAKVIPWFFVFAALWATTLYSYLLFHTLAELFSIVIAGFIFVIAWNARRRLDNGYLLFVGVAYVFLAFLDTFHTMAYRGMGIFSGFGANLPTQLWIAARYMEAISLLLAPLFLTRKPHPAAWLAVYGLTTGLLLLSIFAWGVFPTCYVDGEGLTWFKKGSEYLISMILVGAGAFLWHRRTFFTPQVLGLLLWSIGFTILSEIAFTFYVSVYGLSNMVGHFAKIFSFYLIYRALVVTAIRRPQELLFRQLQDSEERLQTLVDESFDGIFIQRGDRIVFTNRPLRQMLGYEEGELEGREHWCVYGPEWQDITRERAMARLKGESVVSRYEVKAQRKDGTQFDAEIRAKVITVNGKPGIQVWVRDISDRKKVEEELSRVARDWQATFDASNSGMWVLDKSQRVLRSNKAAERMFQHTQEELIGKLCCEIVHGTEEPIAECPLLRSKVEAVRFSVYEPFAV